MPFYLLQYGSYSFANVQSMTNELYLVRTTSAPRRHTAVLFQGVQDAVVNNTGMVEATSVRQENGEIILEADNGTVANSGTLDASGKGTGQTGSRG